MGRYAPCFALYGILGTYNYGTESIVRGTTIALREVWPECRIVYISPHPDDDRIRLQGCDIEIVPRTVVRRTIFERKINSLLRLLHKGRLFILEDTRWLSSVDCVLSIGGDLYTLPPQFKPTRHFYTPHLLDIGEYVLSHRIPFVIWGASIGPFESWPSAKREYIKHLSKMSLITAREQVTMSYLGTIGIQRNVRKVADPAFLTPINQYQLTRKKPNSPLVGVNLSPLSAKYASRGDNINQMIRVQADVLVRLALRYDLELLLLPHVISEDSSDDDLRYLQNIYKLMYPRIPDRIGIILDDPGARKMKGILAQCDVVVAARMHCGVHAVSVGTPALFLAYSSKAHGMTQYIYGDETYCIALEDFVNSEIDYKFSVIFTNRALLRVNLLKKREDFVKDACAGAKYLREALFMGGGRI